MKLDIVLARLRRDRETVCDTIATCEEMARRVSKPSAQTVYQEAKKERQAELAQYEEAIRLLEEAEDGE